MGSCHKAACARGPVFPRVRRRQVVFQEKIKTVQLLHRDLPGGFQLGHPPSHAEGAYPQKCLFEQLRNQVLEMHFDKFRNPSTLQCWKTSFKTEGLFLFWLSIKDVEMVDSVDDLTSSRPIREHQFPKFEILDAKIASALKKIIQNSKTSIGPVQGNLLRDLPELLEDFTENLVDEGVSTSRTPASTSRESDSGPPRMVSGKHSLFTHFAKLRSIQEN